ncbi:MAG: DUF1015 domain-containing protein [Micrococcales bacterium]|nr:DUF1015 domain-containing protein [Micrococcales bacterium]
MPGFEPFPALRFAPGTDLDAVLAPPYDVLSTKDVAALHRRDQYNITHIDVPAKAGYDQAAQLMRAWLGSGVLRIDDCPSLTIYRLGFVDATGAKREIAGVLGGLEVADAPSGQAPSKSGSSTVLPHERTTPKATTDRLDLMRATAANTSPVWGLSLASGLAAALQAPAEPLGGVEIEGVKHSVERICDPVRIRDIQEIMAADDVLIADGHHRYGVSRIYRDQVRAATGRSDSPAEQTLAFVSELIEDQLSIEAIHRLYAGVSAEMLRQGLARYFELSQVHRPVEAALLAQMANQGRLVILWPGGKAEWLTARAGAFDGVRALDGAWLETALEDIGAQVTYQHGLAEMAQCLASGDYTAGVLIRPTSIREIRRTAREGLLMPPKSTFFTPKLLTGWVLRPTEAVPGQDQKDVA